MILSFTLSMPRNNAWNGKWTGEGNLYVEVVDFGRRKKADEAARQILQEGSFEYDFGDGWAARIDVREVDAREASGLRRASHGFCGYNWMIESIRKVGRIEVRETT